jgi:predicted negative regulator of RcsB-dependent stress response
MKLARLILVAVLVLLGVGGWMAWRNEKARRDIRQAASSSKAAVNEEILRNAQRLAETLRKCKQTAETNRETKK